MEKGRAESGTDGHIVVTAEVTSQSSLCGCLVLIVCREISLMWSSESPGLVMKLQLNTKGSDAGLAPEVLSLHPNMSTWATVATWVLCVMLECALGRGGVAPHPGNDPFLSGVLFD